MSYAELLCKTNFSFLQGASHPHELIKQAAQLELTALAITDNNGVYAIPKAYWAKKEFPNLKLIVGAELKFIDHASITLLAKNRLAYGLLCRTLTKAHADKPKGQAAIRWHSFTQLMQESASLGLFALIKDSPLNRYQDLKEIFSQRLYLTLGRFLDGFDNQRSEHALVLAKEHQLDIVATNEVHYHCPQRRQLQDILTATQHKRSLKEAGFHLFSNHERYMKSAKQMQRLFEDMPQAIANTLCIAQQCHFCPSELRYTYPSEWIPKDETAQSYLEKIVWQGAKSRYPNDLPADVRKQLQHELSLIKQLRFADYFLTIYEIVDFAKQKNILCQGRGSAANSVICYCLGITAIDPVRMNLLFERFISVERGEPPDIDVDFEHERREEVIQHIYQKYGRHRAAMLSAVITYQRRSALREVSKAFGVNVGTLSARKLEYRFDELTQGDQKLQQHILKQAEQLKEFPRHLSIHSGGFTLSAGPINEIVPIEPARMENRTIIQWDKYDLDYLGLLKIDILGLGMLSALRKTLDLVDMQLDDIPADDPKTYAMIQKADTVGTFQIESRAQMSMLGRLQPKNFYDLVIEVAIVRPGPIVGKMVHPYLRRRRGEEKVNYYDPRVKKILEKTLGVLLFQEQVMKLAVDLAGFTPGEADELRRAIAAWRSSGSVEKMGRRLMQGLLHSGLPQHFADQVFEQIQGFAAYGFPESHAASFALLAYASCYLKCHHPAQFLVAMVNSQPLGFYANHTLADDARRHGVVVLPVDPNHSQWDCTLENGAVRLGLRVVQGLGKVEALQIVTQRQQQLFHSLADFLDRTHLGHHQLCRLAMGNAFASFQIDQRHALWQLLEYQCLHSQTEVEQLNLFHNQQRPLTASIFSPLRQFDAIREDYQSFAISNHGHPMEPLRRLHRNLPKTTIAQVRAAAHGCQIHLAGLIIVKQRPGTAKGMMFVTIEDESGLLDSAIQPPLRKQYEEIILHHCFVIVHGKLQKDGHTTSLLIKKIRPIFENPYDHPQQGEGLHIEPSKYFS